jgi:hypothetical protein
VRITGNHTFGQILNHLALSHEVASGRVQTPAPPFFMKLMMPLMKRMMINSKLLKPGIKLPAKGESFFWPDTEFDIPTTVNYCKETVDHYKANGPLEKHPFFLEKYRKLNATNSTAATQRSISALCTLRD